VVDAHKQKGCGRQGSVHLRDKVDNYQVHYYGA